MFDIQDYTYDLPEGLIAQVPASRRDRARLLVVDRLEGSFSDHHIYDLPDLLKPGDLLVVNNTRVVPARLYGRKESGGQIEVLVLEHNDSRARKTNTRWCLARAAKRFKKGSHLEFGQGVSGFVEDVRQDGLTKIRFEGALPIDQFIEKKGYEPISDNPPSAGKGTLFSIDTYLDEKGQMPLPPYIKRDRQNGRSTLDRERYQTIFSQKKGAIAAPTAGLHFTKDLIEKLDQSGVSVVQLTLHVGHGTFRPVKTADIRDHRLGEEAYIIDPDAAGAINRAKRGGRRLIAVGTTVVRALETVAQQNGEVAPGRGNTKLVITPGYTFKVVDGIITNFHLPKSSLLFLVSAFGGLDLIKNAYGWAIEKKYRFYSYGDAMLIT